MDSLDLLFCAGVSVQAVAALLLAALLGHFHRREAGGHLGWWAAGLLALALFGVSLALTVCAERDVGDAAGFPLFASLLVQTAGYCAAACVAIGAFELARGRPAVGPGFAAGLPLVLLLLGAATTFSTIDSSPESRRVVRLGLLALVQAGAFLAAATAHFRASSPAPNPRALAALSIGALGVSRLLALALHAAGGGDATSVDTLVLSILPFVDLVLLMAWATGIGLEEVGRLRLAVRESRDEAQRHASKTRDAQHLEAIGRLVGSVAHDFNNLLTALTGYSRLLVRRLPEGSREREFATEIRDASERAVELTTHLQAFSRRHRFRPTVLDLNVHLRSFERIVRRLLGDDVTLRIEARDDRLLVRADPGQLEQLLLQLASNAREAMPDGGLLTISTRDHREKADADDPVSGLAPGRYACLSVTDTGHGFDRAVGERIFEPSFTTHAADGASGLGLATVRGVVKQCGGAIDVDSEPGKGTEFRVYLPRVAEGERREDPPPAITTASDGAPGRVLVVEDERAVLSLVELALGEAGYEVVTATGPRPALETFEREEGRFDVLVTDLVMPEIDGRELADRLLDLRPDLGVVYMTGDPRDSADVRAQTAGDGADVLWKPFDAEEVVSRVGRVLAGRSSP